MPETVFEYRGQSVVPDKLDAFWKRALERLEEVEPTPQWVRAASPAPEYAECFDLSFAGINGARCHARVVFPLKQKGPSGAAIEFHGYTGRISEWAHGMKLALAAQGHIYAGLDCRGQSGASEDPGGVRGYTLNGHLMRGMNDALNDGPRRLFYVQQILDCARLVQILAADPRIDPGRIATYGGSQGGALALASAALVAQVARCAAKYPFLCDFRGIDQMDFEAYQGPYREIGDWFRQFDPLRGREADVFDVLGHIDLVNLAPWIKARTEWTIAMRDQVCPPRSQIAAYNALTCVKELLVYRDFGHELFDHGQDRLFRFLTFQPEP